MDALRQKKITVYFGGSYEELWTEDYTMSVRYSGRKAVEAENIEGKWKAVGGDEQLCTRLSSDCCGLLRQYFEASASVYSAASECLDAGLTLERLPERFHSSGNPLAAPELMRLLMDDCGFSLKDAFAVTAQCCSECRAFGVNAQEVYPMQPRTAHVISILRTAAESMLSVEFDGREKQYRAPFGAVRCGEKLSLSFKVTGGSVKRALVVLCGERFRKEIEMEHDGSFWSASFYAPEQAGAYSFFFRVESADASHWLCPDDTGYRGRLFSEEKPGFRLTVFKRDFDTPEWFRHAVMYQIFPDRFAFSDDGTAERGIEYHRALGQMPELHASLDEPVRYTAREFEAAYAPDDFYGGTLKGISNELPYIKSLGVSCIYLNPIVEARSNHRYDTSDYMKVDPILGDNEDFSALCREAEKLGIHIILDGVYSHTGADSIYFNRYGNYPGTGAHMGEPSPYYKWYDFRSFPDDYRCWWGFKDLPEVNELDPQWQDYVISGNDSVIKTWLRRGAGGWRLDVADELPDSALAEIRRAVKEIKPDAPIIGEVWEDAVEKESYGTRRNYALGYSLDSVMNYPFRKAVLDFLHGRSDAFALRDFLVSQQMNYPQPLYYSLMNLLGSHDTERLRNALATDADLRAMTREEQLAVKISREKLDEAAELEAIGAALQFAVPGVPSIYYGDEQGAQGVNDPFNRGVFRNVGHPLKDIYSQLASERNSCTALSTGMAEFSAPQADVLTVLRWISGGKDALGAPAENGAYLVVINRAAAADITADCSAAQAGRINIRVPCKSYRYIRLY